MTERSIIEAQMQKKTSEIQSLEEKLKSAKIYIKALEDVLKVMDRGSDSVAANGDSPLRKGSLVAQAREVILARGAPIHIDDLLTELGRKVNRETKASLAGSIAAYVRKEEIFSRPAPNTFGLIELGHCEIEAAREEPPSNFGYTPPPDNDEIPF